VARRRGESLPATNTRFWFSPGKFDYQITQSADTGYLETAQVVLQDENQKLTSGGLSASGSVNPLTRAFTCAWTERMEDTYRAEPIWRDMHNIFRHFALARIIVAHNLLERVKFRSRELLDTHIVQPVKLWDTLPGRSLVYNDEGSLGWACGGVSMAFDESNSRARVSKSAGAVARVMSSRRQGAISWAVS
jgi:hypothetical protein